MSSCSCCCFPCHSLDCGNHFICQCHHHSLNQCPFSCYNQNDNCHVYISKPVDQIKQKELSGNKTEEKEIKELLPLQNKMSDKTMSVIPQSVGQSAEKIISCSDVHTSKRTDLCAHGELSCCNLCCSGVLDGKSYCCKYCAKKLIELYKKPSLKLSVKDKSPQPINSNDIKQQKEFSLVLDQLLQKCNNGKEIAITSDDFTKIQPNNFRLHPDKQNNQVLTKESLCDKLNDCKEIHNICNGCKKINLNKEVTQPDKIPDDKKITIKCNDFRKMYSDKLSGKVSDCKEVCKECNDHKMMCLIKQVTHSDEIPDGKEISVLSNDCKENYIECKGCKRMHLNKKVVWCNEIADAQEILTKCNECKKIYLLKQISHCGKFPDCIFNDDKELNSNCKNCVMAQLNKPKHHPYFVNIPENKGNDGKQIMIKSLDCTRQKKYLELCEECKRILIVDKHFTCNGCNQIIKCDKGTMMQQSESNLLSDKQNLEKKKKKKGCSLFGCCNNNDNKKQVQKPKSPKISVSTCDRCNRKLSSTCHLCHPPCCNSNSCYNIVSYKDPHHHCQQ